MWSHVTGVRHRTHTHTQHSTADTHTQPHRTRCIPLSNKRAHTLWYLCPGVLLKLCGKKPVYCSMCPISQLILWNTWCISIFVNHCGHTFICWGGYSWGFQQVMGLEDATWVQECDNTSAGRSRGCGITIRHTNLHTQTHRHTSKTRTHGVRTQNTTRLKRNGWTTGAFAMRRFSL